MKKLAMLFLMAACSFLHLPAQGVAEQDDSLHNENLPIAETKGAITFVAEEAGNLHIKGWVAPLLEGLFPISGIHIRFGTQQKEIHFPIPLTSEYPCFDIAIPLSSQDRVDIQDSLISVTPIIYNYRGYPIYYLFGCTLPFPTPDELLLVGGGEPIELGSEFVSILQRCGLKKSDHILDVGCGLGRIAYALAYYLDSTGRYDGFDIMPSLIQRAQSFITPWFPNFQFQWVNVYNGVYNPTGVIKPSRFKFPYPDNTFDFVVLTSVFTHMLPEDLRHYLSEIKRVLRPGGKCMTTCFLLNNESISLLTQGKSYLPIVHPYGDCFVSSLLNLEGAVGYEEAKFFPWIANNGFTIKKIYYGGWCGRTKCWLSGQDILLLEKL